MQRSDAAELHSFVKAGIAYMGIMAGLAVLGLAFYAIASAVEAPGHVPVPQAEYYLTVLYYVLLAGVSIGAVWLLAKGSRAGAYTAFASLAISVLAPVNSQSAYWIAIPNVAVGLLLLKAFKTLR